VRGVHRFLCALVYGTVLWAMALLAAGGGHGFMSPMLVASSPLLLVVAAFSRLWSVEGVEDLLLLLAGPLLWGSFGLLLWRLPRRRILTAFLVVHYASALVALGMVLARGPLEPRWRELVWDSWGIWLLVFLTTFYIAGQAWLWRETSKCGTNERQAMRGHRADS
jgi:hypothetical protein